MAGRRIDNVHTLFRSWISTAEWRTSRKNASPGRIVRQISAHLCQAGEQPIQNLPFSGTKPFIVDKKEGPVASVIDMWKLNGRSECEAEVILLKREFGLTCPVEKEIVCIQCTVSQEFVS